MYVVEGVLCVCEVPCYVAKDMLTVAGRIVTQGNRVLHH